MPLNLTREIRRITRDTASLERWLDTKQTVHADQTRNLLYYAQRAAGGTILTDAGAASLVRYVAIGADTVAAWSEVDAHEAPIPVVIDGRTFEVTPMARPQMVCSAFKWVQGWSMAMSARNKGALDILRGTDLTVYEQRPRNPWAALATAVQRDSQALVQDAVDCSRAFVDGPRSAELSPISRAHLHSIFELLYVLSAKINYAV